MCSNEPLTLRRRLGFAAGSSFLFLALRVCIFPGATKMDPNKSIPRIIQLATIINLSVAKIQEVLDNQGAPSPSFDEHAPPLPVDIGEAQDAVLDATAELHDLLTEPLNIIHRSARVSYSILDNPSLEQLTPSM